MNMCPCGSSKSLDACCGPYIEGQAPAPTAEALMRSRYTAHCLGKYDYLNETVHPDMRDETDHADMQKWSEAVEWQGLEVLSTSDGAAEDDKGTVSFIAHYDIQGMPQHLHEDAFFSKEDGRWFYVDGTVHTPEPIRREAPKVGRNEPCPCGSGKKYKKCCGK